MVPNHPALGLDWITGGTWLNTDHPSRSDGMKLLPFLSPLPRLRDHGQYLEQWYLIAWHLLAPVSLLGNGGTTVPKIWGGHHLCSLQIRARGELAAPE